MNTKKPEGRGEGGKVSDGKEVKEGGGRGKGKPRSRSNSQNESKTVKVMQ